MITVELVAVHAVMAGCKPEHMPILLAITETLTHPDYRGLTTTTNPTAPLVIINGPIRDKLNIAYETGAAGPEHRSNVCLGLAINSIGDVIGGSKPPDLDRSTLGWPGNTIAIVIGENEEKNPWGPLHVEKGFKKEDDVLTVMLSAEIPSNINDHQSVTAEDLLRVVAYDMRRAGQNSRLMTDADVLVILSPEHASTIFNHGWKDKEGLRKYLWENACIPVKAFPGGGKDKRFGLEVVSKLLGRQATLETCVPIVKEPSRIQIIVSGGPGKHSQYISSFSSQAGVGIPFLISVPVDKWK